ncbi:MAG: hypothetical protein NWF06_01540 [Candidatus Bathyarchaeota archaeon]|nr:hypothetical protein [Candidatus Bathyarchaeum sp.]
MNESLVKFVEGFSKNQLIGYFLLLWAATFLFSSISGFIWLAEGYGSILDVIVDGLWNLADLGCAAVLAMLGLKILNNQE